MITVITNPRVISSQNVRESEMQTNKALLESFNSYVDLNNVHHASRCCWMYSFAACLTLLIVAGVPCWLSYSKLRLKRNLMFLAGRISEVARSNKLRMRVGSPSLISYTHASCSLGGVQSINKASVA